MGNRSMTVKGRMSLNDGWYTIHPNVPEDRVDEFIRKQRKLWRYVEASINV